MSTYKPARVAVASRSFSRNPVLRQELLARYPDATFNDSGASLSGDALVDFLSGHDKAVIALETIDDAILGRLPQLKVISKYGVGLDMLDLQAMARRGILLGWSGGVNRRSVSELVVSMAISLLHRVPEGHVEVREGKWRQIQGRQLTGKTVGILGCGHIGKDVAILMRAFDCKVLAHDILDFPDFYRSHGVIPVSLDELLRESDVLTIHLPLDDSTRDMLSPSRLALMKEGACLINLARGNVVDEPALKTMLISGRLAGAAIDVFGVEPPEDHELLNLPNLIATPHIGGSTIEAVLAMGRAAIDGLDNAISPSRIPA